MSKWKDAGLEVPEVPEGAQGVFVIVTVENEDGERWSAPSYYSKFGWGVHKSFNVIAWRKPPKPFLE